MERHGVKYSPKVLKYRATLEFIRSASVEGEIWIVNIDFGFRGAAEKKRQAGEDEECQVLGRFKTRYLPQRPNLEASYLQITVQVSKY